MNKFVVFAALIAVALASSSSSSSVPAPSSSSAVPAPSSSSAAPVVSSSSVPVVSSSSSSSSVAPVEPSSSSSSVAPVEPSSSSVAPVVSSSSVGPENKTFVPYLPCEFNFTLKGEDADEVQEYTGYINDKSLILLTFTDKFYVLVRCDLPDDKGNCYVQSNLEGNDTCVYQSRDYVMEYMIDPVFLSVEYSTAEYPVTADCPDGSKDCQKYCNETKLCLIADKDNKLVGVENEGKIVLSFIYHTDAVDASVFAMENCENATLDTPVNPCTAPSGSSAKSSSSAASFVQVAYAVVLAALLVALF